MTCKDCKLFKTCTDNHKTTKYKDGDSWANWCDDFRSRHKDKTVIYQGYTFVQNASSGNIWVYDSNGQFRMHAICTKFLTKRDLEKYARDYVDNLPAFNKILKETLTNVK